MRGVDRLVKTLFLAHHRFPTADSLLLTAYSWLPPPAHLGQSSAAFFVFLAATARAGVVATHFRSPAPHCRYDQLEFFAVIVVLIFAAQSEILSARQRPCRDPRRLWTLGTLNDVEGKRRQKLLER